VRSCGPKRTRFPGYLVHGDKLDPPTIAMWYLGSTPIVERNHGLVFSAFFFTTLALVTISMRIYTRTVMVRNLGLDDILIVVALVILTYTNNPRLALCDEDAHFLLTRRLSSRWARSATSHRPWNVSDHHPHHPPAPQPSYSSHT